MQPIKDLVHTVQILAFLIIIVAAVISFYLSKKIIDPLRALIGATDNIIQSNYQQSLGIQGDSELAVLIKNFNKMQETIWAREEELGKKIKF